MIVGRMGDVAIPMPAGIAPLTPDGDGPGIACGIKSI